MPRPHRPQPVPADKPLYKTVITIYSGFEPVSMTGTIEEARRAEVNQFAGRGNDAIIASTVITTLGKDEVAADADVTDRVREYFQHEPTIAGPQGFPRVHATVRRDGYAHGTKFDATAWFETAHWSDLLAVIEANFTGHDHPMDEVAKFFRGGNDAVAAVLDACDDAGDLYIIEVDPEEAEAWLSDHRGDDDTLMTALVLLREE